MPRPAPPRRVATRSLLLLALLCACGDDQTRPRDKAPYKAAALEPLACVPNLDGQIDESELQASFGVPVSYLVSSPGEERGVDAAGKLAADGSFLVDWSADYAGDRLARIEASALDGKWFAPSFPQGQFVAPFDVSSSTLAVYALAGGSLQLWGLASAEEAPAEGKTLLVYKTPIVLYAFPITVGSTWVSTGEIQNGTVRGLPYAGKDTYETKVDGAGELRLPDLTFTQALRVRTRVTLQPAAGKTVITRQVSFLFECFGEVARATSRQGEEEDIFTTAAEVRRLGL